MANPAHDHAHRYVEHGRIGGAFPVVCTPAAAYAVLSIARACVAHAPPLPTADMTRSPHFDPCRSIQRSARRAAPC